MPSSTSASSFEYEKVTDSSTHNIVHEDLESIPSSNRKINNERNESEFDRCASFVQNNPFCVALSLLLLANLCVMNYFFIMYGARNLNSSGNISVDQVDKVSPYRAKNIAFGSCSAYDLRDWTVFTDAVIPTKPDAWIWTGDMVYLDDNEVNCNVFDDSIEWQVACNCTASWINTPPYSCHAGDIEYASNRWIRSLNNEPYSKFLEYMCPNSLAKGYFPPEGTNPNQCIRPIYGIYDDHDFGWNDANRREPARREYKNLFLDAIGESRTSIRRNENRGAWYQYSLNEDQPAHLIDIFLLDERYERDTVPCHNRRAACELVLAYEHNETLRTAWNHQHNQQPSLFPLPSAKQHAWCTDFLATGLGNTGSCCDKDEIFYLSWCQETSHKQHVYYRDLCDVTYEHFGMSSFYQDPHTGEIIPWSQDHFNNSEGRSGMINEIGFDGEQSSPFCEVLGRNQRKWLRQAVAASSAPIKLFISGSVLIYNPIPTICGKNPITSEPVYCTCGGDNLDCYPAAQAELLHIISSATGCPIVITGDYHFSDLKKLHPGNDTVYASVYHSASNQQPIYQIMASGLSDSTAKDVTCEDFRLDPLGLRTHTECSFVRGANFGRILIDYDESHPDSPIELIRLQILSGKIANKVLLETTIDPKTCIPITP